MKSVRTAALAAASLLLLTGSALAAAPPDLGGQSWRASADVDPAFGVPAAPGDVVMTEERSCDPFGNATLTMTASGQAAGPYPGTFQTRVVALLSEPRWPTVENRDLLSASGEFSISSGQTQVTGTVFFDDDLTPAVGSPRSGATGWCLNEPEFPGSATITPQTSIGGAITSYEATITTPDGCVYTDHGGDSTAGDGSQIAGGLELREAPYPQGRTVAQNFQSDGAPLAASAGCDTPSSFEGFFAPVDNLPVLNEVNAGRAIPVRFSLGGDQGLDVFAAGYPRSEEVNCSEIAQTQVDGVEETTSAGSSSLTYHAASGRYHYVWATDDDWAGSCRQFVMRLRDGSVQRANFRFK